VTLITQTTRSAGAEPPIPPPLTDEQLREREAECSMPGRSRLVCWGCPAAECRFNEQPFQDSEDTVLIAERAAALLRENRVWLLNRGEGPSQSGRTLLDDLGDNPEGELLARLIEHRDDFRRLQAVEAVASGALPLEHGATLARMRRHGGAQNAPFERFKALVQTRLEHLTYVPAVGAARHTHSYPHED